ncbi:hypothetical protein CLOACE_20070 [Clostridium acetireducens DSM 10703]|uniref:tRNA_anti-like protein n=1 Tax=Clostridium acetireducens DSM 10703 TaxID=1121290 RepID=A0A1E8EWL3_9CLOT|nr:DNA-binding protein [Clostridium acetireducens]OFI04990.1 hypothetical protein CLOACE_20070 [Clostridium acetireducens DSM 10703]
MIKKLLTLSVSSLLLFSLGGCGNATSAGKVQQDIKKAEVNKEIKNIASKADFTQINNNKQKLKGEVYYIEGVIDFIDESNKDLPMFTVNTEEQNICGVYDVINFQEIEVKKGDKIKVYGKVSEEKSELGAPKITGNVIEKLN